MAKYKKLASIVCMTAGVLMGAVVSKGAESKPEKETMEITEKQKKIRKQQIQNSLFGPPSKKQLCI